MSSIVKENYLKALYSLHVHDKDISLTELSKSLQVSKPSANTMIKNLQDIGWVIYERYKPIQLTDAGEKAAMAVIRKHRLTEIFLQEIMGFGWEEVHDIAEQIEHINSDKLFDRMDEMLEYPTVDPHGSPIPNQRGEMIAQQAQPLIGFEPGDRVQLKALNDSSEELLNYLNDLGITLGGVFMIDQVIPFDHTYVISYDERGMISLSQQVARQMLVEKIEV